eukprot:scaffold219_cov156-Amphora_coffeaeformis.AAC.15
MSSFLSSSYRKQKSLSSPQNSHSNNREGARGSFLANHVGGLAKRALKKKKIPPILLFIVGFGCLLIWQATRQTSPSSSYAHLDLPNVLSSYNNDVGPEGQLGPPRGEAVAMPNLKARDKIADDKRLKSQYGGTGDSPHLGGFASGDKIDLQGLSPLVWENMIKNYNVKSVLDLGCGRGFATSWFYTHGLRTKGVDGSADAFRQSAIPPEKRSELLVEHDFSLGPW